jgi:hypothetical protein
MRAVGAGGGGAESECPWHALASDAAWINAPVCSANGGSSVDVTQQALLGWRQRHVEVLRERQRAPVARVPLERQDLDADARMLVPVPSLTTNSYTCSSSA